MALDRFERKQHNETLQEQARPTCSASSALLTPQFLPQSCLSCLSNQQLSHTCCKKSEQRLSAWSLILCNCWELEWQRCFARKLLQFQCLNSCCCFSCWSLSSSNGKTSLSVVSPQDNFNEAHWYFRRTKPQNYFLPLAYLPVYSMYGTCFMKF